MQSLQTLWVPETIPYTGEQLRSHFIYDRFQLLGPAIVAFAGPAQVDITHMVDLEDVKQKSPIYSEFMLHFLVEHFETQLRQMVLYQRLLMSLMLEELGKRRTDLNFYRIGDDLFEGEAKLTVSIATLSPISGLIHSGINICSDNTPVLTQGLEDYQIDVQEFAQSVLQAYAYEYESIWKATYKVRGVK